MNEYSALIRNSKPIGTGFSYGDDEATSTVSAAAYVWTFLQNFYAAFPDYESRDFGLWTESYGGHYGPEFAAYFEAQNAKIAAGTLTGEKVNLVALGKILPRRDLQSVPADNCLRHQQRLDRPCASVPGIPHLCAQQHI